MKEQLYYDDGTPVNMERGKENKKEEIRFPPELKMILQELKEMKKEMKKEKPKRSWTAVPTRGLSGLINKVDIKEN